MPLNLELPRQRCLVMFPACKSVCRSVCVCVTSGNICPLRPFVSGTMTEADFCQRERVTTMQKYSHTTYQPRR